jgi:hypothetical protein
MPPPGPEQSSSENASGSAADVIPKEGYDRALERLRKCVSPDGYLASPSDKAYYRRVWGREVFSIHAHD